MNTFEQARLTKLDSFKLASSSTEIRNKALEYVAEALIANRDEIIAANEKDLANAKASNIGDAIIKRLKFDDHKIADVTSGIKDLICLKDPVGNIVFRRQLDEGLTLVKQTTPIGVIGVIFESRPDALVQIASLCIKSGNCAILKGGSEALYTNRKLFEIIHKAATEAGIPENCLCLLEARDEIAELLSCHESVDLLIPRGSNAFVQYIMNNSKIPVMGHADGICHVYVDKAADIEKAVTIAYDAKTQYVAACNAAETLLVHRDIAKAFLPELKKAYEAGGVTIKGDTEVQQIISCEPADETDYKTEYLDLIISIKLVDSVEEAIDHINMYGSHHTDAIVTECDATAEKFMQNVDSAGVYKNCSTRFADGYRYGFGAEVGISTGKLHARGPVGIDGLCTYKYKLYGDGHIVNDYSTGVKSFNFVELD